MSDEDNYIPPPPPFDTPWPEEAPGWVEAQLRLEDKENLDDRATAIIRATDLDIALKVLLAEFMINDQKQVEELLGRALGKFSDRIQAAYCLGLIDNDERLDINLVRKIRNEFAHHPLGLSFQSESIRNRCNEFRVIKTELPSHLVISVESPRDLFDIAVILLERRLMVRKFQAKAQKCILLV